MNLHQQYQHDLKLAEENLASLNTTYAGLHDKISVLRFSQAFGAIGAIKSKYQRDIKGAMKAVQVLKAAGLPIAKSTSTAIKGHRDHQMGFKVSSSHDDVRVYFQNQGYRVAGTYRELSPEQIKQAGVVLMDAGFHIVRRTGCFEITDYTPELTFSRENILYHGVIVGSITNDCKVSLVIQSGKGFKEVKVGLHQTDPNHTKAWVLENFKALAWKYSFYISPMTEQQL